MFSNIILNVQIFIKESFKEKEDKSSNEEIVKEIPEDYFNNFPKFKIDSKKYVRKI